MNCTALKREILLDARGSGSTIPRLRKLCSLTEFQLEIHGMHSKNLFLVAFLIFTATETLTVAQSLPTTEPSIIPRPVSVTVAAGVFHLNSDAEIVTKHSARPVGEYLADLLRPTLNLRLVE